MGTLLELVIRALTVCKQFWGQDTPGEERFRAITSSYYRGTQGILLGWSHIVKRVWLR